MSSLPVIAIITAQGCGHCERMRLPRIEKSDNEGIKTIVGRYAWDQEFFTLLLFGGELPKSVNQSPNYRVFNIHIGSMAKPTFEDIAEVTSITWNGSKVCQDIVSNQVVPKSIVRFIRMFPTFAYFDGNSWNGKSPLVGYVMSCRVKKVADGYEIDSNYPFSPKGETPVSVAADILKKPSILIPSSVPEDLRVPPGIIKQTVNDNSLKLVLD